MLIEELLLKFPWTIADPATQYQGLRELRAMKQYKHNRWPLNPDIRGISLFLASNLRSQRHITHSDGGPYAVAQDLGCLAPGTNCPYRR